ncbi:MAG: extensin family protein [Pseudomonadota bacterium]
MAALEAFAARLIGVALTLGVVGVAVLAANRAIPPEHLPWKPLTLADPIGLATKVKAARSGADPAVCRAILQQGGVAFAEVAPRTSGFCEIRDAIKLKSGLAPLAPAGPAMTCRQALAVSLWERQVVQAAALEALGQRVVKIDHYGAYACRKMYGRDDAPVSEHARANALDVAAFRLADGTVISVASDWNDAGPRGRFLHRVRDGACEVFMTTLGPDYNLQHRDHFHLDMGGWPKCS